MPTPDGKPLNEFQRPDSVPPGGVFFYELDVGESAPARFESHQSVDDLAWLIRSYLSLNKMSQIEHLEAKILEFMCDNLPPGFCRKDSSNPKRSITLDQVKDFTRIIWKRAVTSGVSFLAPKEEAERRASLCASGAPGGKPCPLNDQSKCTVCGGLLALIRGLIGRRETKYDPVLGVCGACGCLLRSKVWISKEALKAATSPVPSDQIPDFCWLHEVYEVKK